MTEPRSVDVIAEAAETASAVTRPNDITYTMTSGVIVKITPVPPLAMREAAIQSPPPKVPLTHNAAKDRDEPNPNDPDYIAELEDYQARQLYRVSDVMMMLGTTLTHVPDDLCSPESDDWVEMLEATGIEIPPFKNKHARRLTWMRLYAARTESDIAAILTRIITLSGVTEVEVQHAAAAFLRNAGR